MATVIVKGYVEHIIFQNPDNGYTVLELVQDGEELVLTGSLGRISEGESLRCEGRFVTHPSYGEQFQVERYEIVPPEDLAAIERYLSSGAIKGIGKSLAARIVKKFKLDTLRILDDEPERLAEVKGISENGAREIAAQVSEKRELREAMLYLQQYGISLNLAVRIYDTYGPDLYTVIRENPYQMADDIPGVGFRTADEIATRSGIAEDSAYRIRSGLYHVLLAAVGEGHVYLPEALLLEKASELLHLPPEELEPSILDLIIDKKAVRKERGGLQAVYAAPYYYMELYVARRLADLNVSFDVWESEADRAAEAFSERDGFEIEPEQLRAVKTALTHGVTVITGGPGTGKTTTINALIRVFSGMALEVRLAAPTGRAAKRMTEATGFEAKTIHRLLEFAGRPEDRDSAVHFERNEENPLEADVVIIDEVSMVDLFLMHVLLKAVQPGTRLILVGDASQLPSVGAGDVLRDVIASGSVEVVELKKIFRQAGTSDIVVNAHRINAGETIDTSKKSRDFLFIRRSDSGRVLGAVTTLIREKLPPYVHCGPFDIQVIAPMRKGALGVENLNRVLQEALNPPGEHAREKLLPKGIFREGDKVMQIKNNYQLEWEVRTPGGYVTDRGEGIFNGDLGRIREINHFAETLLVEFDEGRLVNYPFTQTDELELAYAVTVHKSQGSEYPAVILPLLGGPRPLMNRNLIYTAVTRAKSCVCIVGDPAVFQAMVDNAEEQKRYSGLRQCMEEIEVEDAWRRSMEEEF